jgi:hypothetical protein
MASPFPSIECEGSYGGIGEDSNIRTEGFLTQMQGDEPIGRRFVAKATAFRLARAVPVAGCLDGAQFGSASRTW